MVDHNIKVCKIIYHIKNQYGFFNLSMISSNAKPNARIFIRFANGLVQYCIRNMTIFGALKHSNSLLKCPINKS